MQSSAPMGLVRDMADGDKYRRGGPLAKVVSPRYSARVTGAEVRRRRARLRLTQAALADRLGVTRVTVARWETGVYAIPEPTARLLQRIGKEAGRARRSR